MGFFRAVVLIYTAGTFVLCCGTTHAQDSNDSDKKKIDYSRYLPDIQARIKTHWHPSSGNKSVKPVVFFKVSKNGTIKNVRMMTPSADSKMDQSVLDAVEETSPLPAPPGGRDIDVQFTFEYNVRHPRRLATNWDNLWDLRNVYYDLTHIRTLKLLGRELAVSNPERLAIDFGPFVLLLFIGSLLAFKTYHDLKLVSSFFPKIPQLEDNERMVSAKLSGTNYAERQLPWEELCSIKLAPLIFLVLISLFYIGCGLIEYLPEPIKNIAMQQEFFKGNENLLGLISLPMRQVYLFLGLSILTMGGMVITGYPRFWQRLKVAIEQPGRQVVITINKANNTFPYIARIEKYIDVLPIESNKLYLGIGAYPVFSEKLPLTDNAVIYLDKDTGKPIALRMRGNLFYVLGSPLLQRSLFMPWSD